MSFTFTHNGQTYCVHTEVGEGATRVVVQEQQQQQSMEPEDEQ